MSLTLTQRILRNMGLVAYTPTNQKIVRDLRNLDKGTKRLRVYVKNSREQIYEGIESRITGRILQWKKGPNYKLYAKYNPKFRMEL